MCIHRARLAACKRAGAEADSHRLPQPEIPKCPTHEKLMAQSRVYFSYESVGSPPEIHIVFRETGTRDPAELVDRPRRRPDADVHQRGDGAVQEGLSRAGLSPAWKQARDYGAEVRARGRKAQRSRAGWAHRPSPHLLRDARQLLVWRLLQARRDSICVGVRDEGAEAPTSAPSRERLR